MAHIDGFYTNFNTIIMCFIYKIAHAIRRYVSLGNNLKTGNDIESSVKNLQGTSIAHLEPKRNIEKRKW